MSVRTDPTSTAPPDEAATPAIDSTAVAPGSTLARLTLVPVRMGTVLVGHATTDFFSMMIIPILPVLKVQTQMDDAGGAKVIMTGSIASGLVQPVAAWISDHLDTRIFGPAGLVIAAGALACLGLVDSLLDLVILWGVATIGIGMFHPVGAAAMGQLSAKHRSRGVAFFFLAGMAGHALGANFSPWWVGVGGTGGYVWLLIPGIAVAVVLHMGIARIPHRHETAQDEARAMPSVEHRARWMAMAVLYVGNILRFTVNMALLTLLWLWAEEVTRRANDVSVLTEELSQQASVLNGHIDTGLILGMAIGGLGAGAVIRPGREKGIMLLTGLLGVPAILALPNVTTFPLAFALAILSGIGFAAATPLSLSLGQRFLPHRTSLASGLMLGGAWMFAAFGPYIAERSNEFWDLSTAFAIVAGLLLAATLLTLALPGKLVRDTAVSG